VADLALTALSQLLPLDNKTTLHYNTPLLLLDPLFNKSSRSILRHVALLATPELSYLCHFRQAFAMLCEVCLNIFRGSFPRRNYEVPFHWRNPKHHDSIESLQRSALEDCDICLVFCDEIPSMSLPGSENIQFSTTFNFFLPDVYASTENLEFTAKVDRDIRSYNFICEPTTGTRISS